MPLKIYHFLYLRHLGINHYAYVHSIMFYGIIFWANSAHSNLIFKVQKRTVRITMKAKSRNYCCPFFRFLKILLFYSQYIVLNVYVYWRLAVNILNKEPRTNDKGWSSSLGVGRGANNPSL
jgi:hypothetical protein